MENSYTNSFAKIYDDIMQEVPYQFWFKYLKDLLSYYNLEVESILELAAGTGNMTEELINLPKIKEIKALDLSSAMLERAENKLSQYELKNLKLEFVQADMTDFKFPGNFDLILSVFDSYNYLLTEKDLKESFSCAAEVLQKDGLFIFDMNSIKRINTIEEKKTMLEGENYSCLWEDIVNTKESVWQVKLQISPEDDKLPAFEEFHTEKGYEIKTIKKLLQQSGFKGVEVYRSFNFFKANDKVDRIYFVAALSEERLAEKKGFMTKLYFSIKNEFKYLLIGLKTIFKQTI
ncbi:class I SAM-dependent DNA methyltransferase [Halanaerobium hydrogeniformans]|uniref:Methyltransferase type 11 n=1 Tax=Halanaerobium hydrogeniformans TaxID=656519 RepID=E4RPW4_HALHG|nr:class I SAM-dependent methyltransferase [Halanaerobium hydrogeniformans]ADQ14331.1 Methyltransferase type 11 [Halanaerobium hydrogeniformans]